MGKDEHECGEDCSCGEDMPTVTLIMEDDTEVEYAVLGTFDSGVSEYIALIPVDGDAEEGVSLYKFVEDDEGNMIISVIESDEEFEMASKAFDELFDEEDE